MSWQSLAQCSQKKPVALSTDPASVRANTVLTDSAYFAPRLIKINICSSGRAPYLCQEKDVMFIAQMLLCSSIVVRCIGVEDETGLVSNLKACEMRIEEMVNDAREIMPLFVVVHVDCKEVEGIAV